MINNRQNGRRRGRGSGGGGGGPRQGGGQRDSGNRIDSRARGNAAQLLEKYKNLAADSQRQGDRVQTEYYLQFADHYFRVLSDQRGRADEQQQQRRQPSDAFDDDDFDNDGEQVRADDQPRYRDRDERGQREDRQRDDRQRDDRSGDEAGNQREAAEEAPREERPRRRRREERPARDEAPRAAASAPANDEGDNADHGFDADRLPPALTAAPAEGVPGVEGEMDEAPRPRRRRRTAGASAAQPG